MLFVGKYYCRKDVIGGMVNVLFISINVKLVDVLFYNEFFVFNVFFEFNMVNVFEVLKNFVS